MRCCLLILALFLSAGQAAAETITIQAANQRFRVIDTVRRAGEFVYVILDTETGEIRERLIELPPRKITVKRKVWDPIAGRYREIVGYDARSLAVYRDEPNHSHVVYWVTEKSQFDTTPLEGEPLLPSQPQPLLPPPMVPCCCGW